MLNEYKGSHSHFLHMYLGKITSLGQRTSRATLTHTDVFEALLDVRGDAKVSSYKILCAHYSKNLKR